ncbi:MAG: S8 family serine peptidase [Candidatus Aminicenantes bacterium]|nr:S8 family serine peptidase [Candidatus Aminicenantes bacterium]
MLVHHSSKRTGGIIALAFLLGSLYSAAGPLVPGQSQGLDTPPALQKALFAKLKVAEAWQLTKGSPDVLVGVIDNGFDFYHPLLKGRLLPGFYASGGFHMELEGTIAHGTAIASIIAAQGGLGSEMIGLAPDCRIVTASQGMIEHVLIRMQQDWAKSHPGAPIDEFMKKAAASEELKKFGRDWTSFQAAANADAILYLVDRGVRVINISGLLRKSLFRVAADWDRLEAAFKHAADKGVLLILAAGNNAVESDDYPGGEAAVLIVGASKLDDTRWEQETKMMGRTFKQGSNFGKRLGVMAPTDNILTCVPHEKRFYASDDGPMGAENEAFKGLTEVMPVGATSCAAPIATALAALVFSLRPDLDGPAVADLIKKGSDDIGDKGFDKLTGWGRVNFLKTLQLAQSAPHK